MQRPGNPATLVHFRCTNPEHTATSPPGSTLTLHEGLWAYCPLDVRRPDHHWVETGGVPLGTLLGK